MSISIDQSAAKAAYPRFYQLNVMLVKNPRVIYNELEDVTYTTVPGDIVLKGTMGEEWVIPSKKLAKYELRDGRALTFDAIEEIGRDVWIPIQTAPVSPSTPPTMVVKIPVNIQGEVIAEGGIVLQVNREGIDHGDGDYVCGVDTPWPWVVNGKVFQKTYRIAD